jgi:DNA-binding NarL/FixJ family response regulator
MNTKYDAGQAARTLRVIVVDDHTTFSDLLCLALNAEDDLECVGTAADRDATLTMVSDVRPDIVVMDVQLGGDDGVEVTAQLTARHEDLRVVILTAHASRDLMRRAIAARACGLLPKNGALPDLLRTLRSARRGGFVVDPRLFQSLLEKPEDPLPALTPRELMVLRQLAAGKDTTTVARQLGLSVHTCRGYVKSLLVKLDAHSQLEAVAIAIRRGIVDV